MLSRRTTAAILVTLAFAASTLSTPGTGIAASASPPRLTSRVASGQADAGDGQRPKSAPTVERPPVQADEAHAARVRGSSPDNLQRLVTRVAQSPIETLAAAVTSCPDELVDLRLWNSEHPDQVRIGFRREFRERRFIEFGANVHESDKGGGGALRRHADSVTWTGRIDVEGAYASRLILENVTIPKGAQVWACGVDAVAQGPVDRRVLSPDGTMLAPSVMGSQVWIEVYVPSDVRERVSFELAGVIEVFDVDENGAPRLEATAGQAPRDESCLVDINCVSHPDRDLISRGIGRMAYYAGGGYYVCTGGLLNDIPVDYTPFFLTANHCVATQDVVSTLEIWWDYRRSGCNGAAPSPSALPKSYGGTLLATGSGSDFSLLRLSSAPGQRTYLGWESGAVPSSTLYRISNPGGNPQVFSTGVLESGPARCSALPSTSYHYSDDSQGGTAGGSSGSPVWTSGGIVVGQLYGKCGPDPSNACHPANSTVDGRFSQTYQYISSWLQQGGSGGDLAGTPTNLAATAPSSGEVRLSWTDNTTVNVVFHIERAAGGGAYQEVAISSVNATSHSDFGVAPSTSYTYRVRARSTVDGRFTAYSSPASVVTPSGGPSAPTGLYASRIKKKKVDLRWTDTSPDEDYFDLLYYTGGAWVSYGSMPANSTSVRVINLSRRTVYRLGVRSCRGATCSQIVELTVMTR